MATFHASIKSGKRGRALEHSDYIGRVGRYGRRPDANHVIAQKAGNLPSWAANARAFWSAADRYERLNGAAYRELELALPRELSHEQNVALVEDLVAKLVGSKSYQYAIHLPAAALEGGPQPHVHLMISDRVPDGIVRPEETHFRRYNARDPGLGGCRKDSGGKDRGTLRTELVALRKTCADTINRHLELCGYEARVDHRSNTERGVTAEPGRHLGPARTRCHKRGMEHLDVGDVSEASSFMRS